MNKYMSITHGDMIAENGYVIKNGRAVLRYTIRRDHTFLTEENGYECGCTYHIIMKNGRKLPGHPFGSLLALLQYVESNPKLIE